jgi:hypothetical protein
MNQSPIDRTPLSELRANFIAALAVLLVIGAGSWVIVTLLGGH